MRSPRVRWGLASLFVGLLAAGALLASLVDESTGGWTRALVAPVAALALPAGLVLLGSGAWTDAMDWWDERSVVFRLVAVAASALVALTPALEASGGAGTSLFAFLGSVGLVLLVAGLVAVVVRVAVAHGAPWSLRAATWALGIACASLVASAVRGHLTPEVWRAELDTLLAATSLGVPFLLVVAIVGDAMFRAWRPRAA